MSEEKLTRAAVVTGGSRGIGRAVCVALAKQGCNVVVNYCHGEAAAAETAALCKELGVEAVTVQADVSTAEGCKKLFEEAVNAFGRVDILVNNAGVTRDNLILRLSEEDFDTVLNANLKGAFLCCKEAARRMVRQRYGRIVNAFTAAFMLQNVFQSFLIAAEKPKLGLAATVAAGVTNMALDALFVAGFRWGIAGAAVATGLSQCVGGLFPLVYFLRPNSSRLRLVRTRLELRPLLNACGNGSSELMSNISSSIVSMVYNFQLLKYLGEDGVSAYGVLMYVQFVFVAIYIGYSIGCAPIVGFHYGAQNHAELKNMLKKRVLIR